MVTLTRIETQSCHRWCDKWNLHDTMPFKELYC